ncbi:MAG: hypothetical protein GX825_06410, partial [Syntrophomonadaceae bacterium]|nr:hypothetical protein [Syntrophomonadaceae bacterium]
TIDYGGFMDEKKRNQITILFSVALIALLSVLFFAYGSSNDQERQIINVFTPGKTHEVTLQTQQSGDEEAPMGTAGSTSETQPEPTPLLPDQPTMMITNTQGLPIIVTQTRAATQPNQPTSTQKPQATAQNPYPITSQTPNPTNKPAATSTSTTKPSNTPTSTFTKTLTPTATVQTGWAGTWTVWFQQVDGNYISGEMTIDAGTSEFNTTVLLGGKQYTFEGRIILNATQVLGSWTSDSTSGGFWWGLTENQEFVGGWDNQYGFCGIRAGQSQPEPCFSPSPR